MTQPNRLSRTNLFVTDPSAMSRRDQYQLIYYALNKAAVCLRLAMHLNCGIRHVTVPIATRILIANVRHIGVSNMCVINLVYFKMQV